MTVCVGGERGRSIGPEEKSVDKGGVCEGESVKEKGN